MNNKIDTVSVYRIVLIDDHPIVRQGLKQIIEIDPEFKVVEEASNADDAIKIINATNPDIAIIDISLDGDINGIDLVKAVKQRFPEIICIVLSMYEESLYAERAIRAGAKGYIVKKEATKGITDIIRKVISGEIYLSQQISARILGKLLHGSTDTTDSSIEILSDREFEVFQLVGNGFSSREIADKLNLSIHTIESHKRHIREKLKLKNAMDLVKHAVQWVLTQEK